MTYRKERLYEDGNWRPTGQYWREDDPMATTITPGLVRITKYNPDHDEWEPL